MIAYHDSTLSIAWGSPLEIRQMIEQIGKKKSHKIGRFPDVCVNLPVV